MLRARKMAILMRAYAHFVMGQTLGLLVCLTLQERTSWACGPVEGRPKSAHLQAALRQAQLRACQNLADQEVIKKRVKFAAKAS